MRTSITSASIAVVVAVALAACGGGGGDGTVPAGNGSPSAGAPSPAAPSAAGPGTTGTTTVAQNTLTWSQPAGLSSNSWHWTASNPSGSLMVATAIPGGVYLSHDQGVTWTQQAGLPAGSTIWISADMSDDGQVIVAVALNGGMYRSMDGGGSWSRIDTAFNATENLDYESVALSADGTRIVAAVLGGGIWKSANGTAETPTFTQATMAGGDALVNWWRAVDSDATGMRVVAASHNGDVWISENGGLTFAPLDISVDGAAVGDGWYRLALSRDGTTLALVGNEDYADGVPAGSRSTGLYVGHFAAGAWTFTRASNVAGSYTRVAIAANAPVIAATLSGPTGMALVSSNNGASFSPLSTPGGESVWRSIALTGDASHALLAAGTFFGDPGNLYVSSGALAP